MRYIFSWRRGWFWHRQEVTGHRYEAQQDKMVLFLKDGGVQEIKHWMDCECRLGSDWFLETKKAMEKTTGTPISVNAN